MARRRYISTEISTDKATNKLGSICSPMAVLLYTWMIPHAEDDGGITSDPDEILLTVIPGFKSVTADDVSGYIKSMLELKLLEPGDDGRYYFPEKSFYKHQSYIPENKRNHRKTPKNTDNRRESPQNTASPSLSPSPSPSPSERDISKDEIAIRRIDDKAFEFGMNGISPEFMQDAEIRLKEGTEAELIIKALAKAKEKASSRGGVFSYAISVLQGWAAEGIKTMAQWNEKHLPKADKPPGKKSDKPPQLGNFGQRKYSDGEIEGMYKDV